MVEPAVANNGKYISNDPIPAIPAARIARCAPLTTNSGSMVGWVLSQPQEFLEAGEKDGVHPQTGFLLAVNARIQGRQVNARPEIVLELVARPPGGGQHQVLVTRSPTTSPAKPTPAPA